MRRYLHGWFMWARAIYMARTKKRGAGPMRWSHAFKMASAYRWIVDGQGRGSKPPRWVRRGARGGTNHLTTCLWCMWYGKWRCNWGRPFRIGVSKLWYDGPIYKADLGWLEIVITAA